MNMDTTPSHHIGAIFEVEAIRHNYVPVLAEARKVIFMRQLLRSILFSDDAQDVAEYAIMLGVVLVLVMGTVQLIAANANNVFSGVAGKVGN